MVTALLLLFVYLGFSDSTSTDSAYLRGQELHSQGEYMQAMDVWLTEWRTYSLDDSYEIDPRCAVAFIKTATEQEMTSTYKVASLFYLEALKSPKMPEFYTVLEEEWKTTALLSSVYGKSFWESVHKKLPEDFGNQATEFWRNLDPNPLTEHNEGLVRFFERRAIAEEMFPDSDYDDERKRTIVTLGKPDHVISGKYSPKWATINGAISDLIGGGEEGQLYFNYMREILIRMNLHFEIWRYANKEIVFFSEGGYTFKESNISQFVPIKLKRLPRLGSLNVEVMPYAPEFFVLFDVSQQLANKSELYARHFMFVSSELEAAVARAAFSKINLIAEANAVTKEEREIQTFARLARPENTIAENPNYYVTSSLSEFVFLRPKQGNYIVETHNWAQINRKSESQQSDALSQSMDLSKVNMKTSLQTEFNKEKQDISMTKSENDFFFAPFSTTFPLDESSPLAVIQTNALIPLPLSEDSSATSSVFLGSSSKNVEFSLPKTASDRFSFSEVVLGFSSESQPTISELYSFQPARENVLAQGKNLAFYLEIYPPENATMSTQTVTLRISTKDESGIAFLRRRGAKSVQLNLDVSQDWNPVELEYETKDFEQGKYTLVLELSGEGIKKPVVKEVGFVVR